MKFKKMSRRHFLEGMGGASLALPFLPSLWPRELFAQTTVAPKFLVVMANSHGCLSSSNLYPMGGNPTGLTESDVIAGHRMRRGALNAMLQERTVPAGNYLMPGGEGSYFSSVTETALSPVLGSFLNPHLSRLNVIRGLDIPFYIGHHVGGYLGNFHAHDGTFPSRQDSRLGLPSLPSVDRLIANSSGFYSPGDPMLQRTLHVGARGESISSDVDPSTGTVRPLARMSESVRGAYERIFNQGLGAGSSLVDRVLNDFNRLRASAYGPGRRISADDKTRLDQHMDGLRDLERRIGIIGGSSCPQNTSADWVYGNDFWANSMSNMQSDVDAWVRFVVAMFACGYTRVATIHWHEPPSSGDYHQAVAHAHFNAAPQERLMRDQRFFAEHALLNFINRMQAIQVYGTQTMLDRGLVVWHQESSQDAHNSTSLPTITAGSAGGALATGLYLDYRNLASSATVMSNRPGVPIQRWLRTLLDAYGVSPSAYERSGMYGYGDPYRGPTFAPSYSTDLMVSCNSPLPHLRIA